MAFWWHQAQTGKNIANRCCTVSGSSNPRRISKFHRRLNSYSNFTGLGGGVALGRDWCYCAYIFMHFVDQTLQDIEQDWYRPQHPLLIVGKVSCRELCLHQALSVCERIVLFWGLGSGPAAPPKAPDPLLHCQQAPPFTGLESNSLLAHIVCQFLDRISRQKFL